MSVVHCECQVLPRVEESVAGGDRGVEPIVSVLTDTRKVTFNSLRFYVVQHPGIEYSEQT